MPITKSTTEKKTDWDIHNDVRREMIWDTTADLSDIGVGVKHGIVTLSGSVDSWAKLRAAEEAAHRVSGVLDVANDLVVNRPSSGQKTDASIALAIRQALEWDVFLPDEKIRSTVRDGIVTLEGDVAYWSQRSGAERAIERLAGIRRVINRIEVHPVEPIDLDSAHRAVRAALERHAAREAAHIELRATGDKVVLTGVVHTWQEREAVVGVVRQTRGVREVIDDLRIAA